MIWETFQVGSFAEHCSEWDALNNANGASPVLASGFVSALLSAFAKGDELLAICRVNAVPVAAGVLRRTRAGVWETFQPAQAPLGIWVQSREIDTEIALRHLMQRLPGMSLLAGLTQLDPEIVPRPAPTACMRTLDYIETAHLGVASDFQSYWQARGKNLQQNIRKQRTRLQKEAIAASLDVITDVSGIARAIADYGRLESAGWKGAEGTAVHPDNAQGVFYRLALEDACARGCGCVFRYRFGETPIAMDLCVRSRDAVVILKTAYDETLKGYSPAMLMRYESFAGLFGDGRTRRIEFYGRIMDWHTRLTQDMRTLYHVNLYRWGVLPATLQHLKRWGPKKTEQPAATNAPHAAAADSAS